MMKLVKCKSTHGDKGKKSFWQLRWEKLDGTYIYAHQLGKMTYRQALKCRKEFKEWRKKWSVK